MSRCESSRAIKVAKPPCFFEIVREANGRKRRVLADPPSSMLALGIQGIAGLNPEVRVGDQERRLLVPVPERLRGASRQIPVVGDGDLLLRTLLRVPLHLVPVRPPPRSARSSRDECSTETGGRHGTRGQQPPRTISASTGK